MLTKQETVAMNQIRQLIRAVENDTNPARQKESQNILEHCGQVFEKNVALNAEKLMTSQVYASLKKECDWDVETYASVSYTRHQWIADVENEAKQCRMQLDQLCQTYNISQNTAFPKINTITLSELFAVTAFAYAAEAEAEIGNYLLQECAESMAEMELVE